MNFKAFIDEKMKPLLEKNVEIKELNEKFEKSLNLYNKAKDVYPYIDRKYELKEGLFSVSLTSFKANLLAMNEEILKIPNKINELDKKLKKTIFKKHEINMDIADLKDRLRMIPLEMIKIQDYIDFMEAENAKNIDLYLKSISEACGKIQVQIAKRIIRENYNEPVVEHELKSAIFDHSNYLKSRQNSAEYIAVSEITEKVSNKKVQEFLAKEIAKIMTGDEEDEREWLFWIKHKKRLLFGAIFYIIFKSSILINYRYNLAIYA